MRFLTGVLVVFLFGLDVGSVYGQAVETLNPHSCVDDLFPTITINCDSYVNQLGDEYQENTCPDECDSANEFCEGGIEKSYKVLSSGSSTNVPTVEDTYVGNTGQALDISAVHSCYRVQDCTCEQGDNDLWECKKGVEYTVFQLFEYEIPFPPTTCPGVVPSP